MSKEITLDVDFDTRKLVAVLNGTMLLAIRTYSPFVGSPAISAIKIETSSGAFFVRADDDYIENLLVPKISVRRSEAAGNLGSHVSKALGVSIAGFEIVALLKEIVFEDFREIVGSGVKETYMVRTVAQLVLSADDGVLEVSCDLQDSGLLHLKP